MLIEWVGTILLGLGLALPSPPTPAVLDATVDPRATAIALLPAAQFRSQDRAVTNWHQQAALQLALDPGSSMRVLTGTNPAGVSRCVRLNNYWCIKRAGWSGEIAADADGHVAFATALDGAVVAAVLLRRYYNDYRRHSALAIVSHWAPAQCSGSPTALQSRRTRTAPATGLTSRPSSNAPRGLAGTLRARFLAGHTRGGQGRIKGRFAPSMRRTIIADRSLSMMPAPEIAVGMGETVTVVAPRRSKTTSGATPVDATRLSLPAPSGDPAGSCVADTARIRAYAIKAIAGVASGIDDDLDLFTPDGSARPNLARLMSNMAHVEIGPLAVREDLVASAIARMGEVRSK